MEKTGSNSHKSTDASIPGASGSENPSAGIHREHFMLAAARAD